MNIDWTDLRRELRLWHSEARVLPLWWRDDDAIAPTQALEQLTALSLEVGVPVHLAIIPQAVTLSLAETLAETMVPVVHGWRHCNNGSAGQKKAEFGLGRSLPAAQADLSQSMARMRALFGARLSPMFVPPWNRFDPNLMPVLVELGFDALSTFLPRKQADPALGLRQINTHIDPIFWRGTRGLVPAADMVAQTVALLQDRRLGRADAEEPLGYLTHHLVHDADIWEFSRQFLSEMCDGPVTLYRHDKKEVS